ncbi:hypothetical protein [Enterobacter cloacae]|uniref:tail fiber/spike domain-containing protein n=1 Tax=Enterobacter cloacae TaxID=550 RepID=UPI001F5D8CF1|nr:hypothetical protein [Enterobacter cloacae]
MATQPTQDAVPSESPRDLKFNAGKIDEFVTSLVNTYVDRFGNEHYTIEGLRWLAQQAIAQYGWIPVGTFQAGATLTLPNQILKDTTDGEYYRWDGSFLPAGKVVPSGSTPSSTGGTGIGAWISVGDSALRSMLGHTDGESLVGGATYAQIRASNVTGNQIKCLGRSSNRDGGEGWFFLDSADTTTADDDGTVLVDSVGRRWKRSYDGAKMAAWFGVKSGTEVSSAIQSMLNIGTGGIDIKDGQYNSTTKIVVDLYNGGASYPPPGRSSSRFDFTGTSMANTTFNTNGNDFLEAIYGGTIPTQAVAAFFRYKNFSIYGPTVASGVGLRITGAAYSQLDSVHVVKMSTGASLTGVLTSEIRNSLFRVCAKNGLYFDTGGNSTVNALTINNTVFVDNGEMGVLGNIGARFTLRDCNFETCGTTNGATAQGAVRLTVKEPMATVNIEGAWFEGNAGEADLYIDNATAGLITVNISSSVFIRGVGGRWCTNNIKTTTSGGGLIKIIFGDGNQFYSMGSDYTPDVSRPYFNFNGRTIPVGIDKCNFNETTSKSLTSVSYSDVVISGAVSSAGALLAAPPRCTSSKVTTGVYSLVFSEGLSINTDSILCTATSRTDAILVMRAVPVSANEVRVYTVNTAGAPTDGAFNFMITSSR